jgi:hypothetical protein
MGCHTGELTGVSFWAKKNPMTIRIVMGLNQFKK